ncbi:MAG: PIN domain-containing protein [Methanosphaera sp.]|nr:PIN domain-containing protein [Methanosphaera sp.]
MLKIMINYDFLEALIFEENKNHETANKIANTIQKDHFLYIPCHVLFNIMKKLDKYDHETNIKFLENIQMTTRIDYQNNKQIFQSAYELYKSNNSLTLLDCITIKYMQSKQIKHIISFNQQFDKIKKIKRLYKLDEYNPKRLNFNTY